MKNQKPKQAPIVQLVNPKRKPNQRQKQVGFSVIRWAQQIYKQKEAKCKKEGPIPISTQKRNEKERKKRKEERKKIEKE